MQIWRPILFVAIGVAGTSCGPTDSADSEARHQAWLLNAIKGQAASHQHVLLVRINESTLHRRPQGYQPVESKATVVHTYKGDWKIGEQIALHQEFESVPETWKPKIGLWFIMTDQRTNTPIDVLGEEIWDYRPDYDQQLRSLFSSHGNLPK